MSDLLTWAPGDDSQLSVLLKTFGMVETHEPRREAVEAFLATMKPPAGTVKQPGVCCHPICDPHLSEYTPACLFAAFAQLWMVTNPYRWTPVTTLEGKLIETKGTATKAKKPLVGGPMDGKVYWSASTGKYGSPPPPKSDLLPPPETLFACRWQGRWYATVSPVPVSRAASLAGVYQFDEDADRFFWRQDLLAPEKFFAPRAKGLPPLRPDLSSSEVHAIVERERQKTADAYARRLASSGPDSTPSRVGGGRVAQSVQRSELPGDSSGPINLSKTSEAEVRPSVRTARRSIWQ